MHHTIVPRTTIRSMARTRRDSRDRIGAQRWQQQMPTKKRPLPWRQYDNKYNRRLHSRWKKSLPAWINSYYKVARCLPNQWKQMAMDGGKLSLSMRWLVVVIDRSRYELCHIRPLQNGSFHQKLLMKMHRNVSADEKTNQPGRELEEQWDWNLYNWYAMLPSHGKNMITHG